MGCSDSRIGPAHEANSPEPMGNQESAGVDGQDDTDMAAASDAPKHLVQVHDSFAVEALELTNEYRQIHQVEPLRLNAELCELSNRLCRHLVDARMFCNSEPEARMFQGEECGENLFRTAGSKDKDLSAESAIQSWYDEVDNYHADIPGFDITTCHFTQLVWKGSREMGIAHGSYNDDEGFKRAVVVAHYFPAGNTEGAYEDNVIIPDGLFDS